MPRELSNEPCEITFDDRVSGDKITVYYDVPTTAERVRYTNGYVTRKGNQVVATIGELRMKAGAAKMRGFKTGAFSIPGKGLISSTPGEPNYEPNWKGIVKQYASDVIEMLAIHIFEAPLMRVASPAAADALEILPPDEGEWDEHPAPAPIEKDDEWEDPSTAPEPKADPKAGKEDKETNPL